LLEALLAPDDPTTDVPTSDDSRPGLHDTLTGVTSEAEPVVPASESGDPVSQEPEQEPGHPQNGTTSGEGAGSDAGESS
jgi:proteasome alpha subunit